MGLLGDLFDTAVDAGKDLLSDGAGGLFDSGDEGGGLLDSALGAITGGDDGGGLLGGVLGGSGGGGGLLGGLLGESGEGGFGGAVDNLLGDAGGAVSGLLGDAGGLVDEVTSAVDDGSWADTLGGVVDQWSGGDGGLGGLLGGDGGGALGGLLGGDDGALGGLTNQIGEFLPPGLSDAAGSITGGDGSWAGSLLDQVTGEISDQIPDEWTSVTDSILGSGLGEGGFEGWVEQGTDALGSLGVPDDFASGLFDCMPSLEPDTVLGIPVPTQQEMADRLEELFGETGVQPGNTGIVPPDLGGGDEADGPVTRDLGGDADDLDLELDVDDGGDVAVEPAATDDLGLDDAPGSEPDLPAVPETADIDPGAQDIDMTPSEPAPPEPAPVEAPEPEPEPADEFDQAISAADDIESSTDELFEGLE